MRWESGDSLSLVFADLDHFKAFNDTHGHQLGDQVLKLVGKTLHDLVKGKDTATRYGGRGIRNHPARYHKRRRNGGCGKHS